jgi:hypothetical protein
MSVLPFFVGENLSCAESPRSPSVPSALLHSLTRKSVEIEVEENPRPCLKLRDEDGALRSEVKLLLPIGHAFVS